MKRLRFALLAVIAAAGCLACTLPDSLAATPVTAHCTVVAGKADKSCTPGVLNPLVTQATIGATVCAHKAPGDRETWTQRQRPPASYTSSLKKTQMREYGLTGQPADYEEDHLIPLSIGGSPRDPHNLFPELWVGATGANVKDDEELALWRAVCASPPRMTLAQAQAKIITDWTH